MGWTLLVALVLALGLALAATLARRLELGRMRARVHARERARADGSAEAKLQHPVIDLSRCLGCGTCVAVCPEDDVLELVHGQAMVVKGARCQGISACERECPVGAITVTIADLAERRDVPAIDNGLEAVGEPGLFLAGEVTAHALIKTAVDHGTAVGAEVARRIDTSAAPDSRVLDLCIVGAGPAGLACSLEAKRNGLSFLTLDQETTLGGTVAKYPRRKLVMTQPVEMPLVGRLSRTSYTKEELIELWRGIAEEAQLPIRGGEVFEELARDEEGNFRVRTQSGEYLARHVCLALGRRGTPTRLGIPGEEASKVAYSLLDARSYQGRRVLVVGGGDSAVEAALALSEQPGNQVTLSYRREAFFRIRSRNEERLQEAVSAGRLVTVLSSDVTAIHPEYVELTVRGPQGLENVTLPNDDVFVMAGGVAPVDLLERSGVSFDPSLREAPEAPSEQGTGLLRALSIGFVLAALTLAWALWHHDYYTLPRLERPAHPQHQWLRPGRGAGLALGVAATAMVAINLLYLVRRSPRFRLEWGSLQAWMTSHVATGILALLCALLHGAMEPRDTVGGHAFWALAALVLTGAIGRYFYAYVPRAANGRELDLAEVKSRLGRLSEEWDQGQVRFRERARREVEELIDTEQWKASFLGRVVAVVGARRRLGRTLAAIGAEGRAEGIDGAQVEETLELARRAHRTALMAAHYEDLRAILNTWRYLHRWGGALLVALLVLHVVYALTYSAFWFDGGAP